MNTPATSATSIPATTAAQELFALSDEQILQIEPESTASATVGQPFLAVHEPKNEAPTDTQSPGHDRLETEVPSATNRLSEKAAQPEMAVPFEPPPWLAAQMKDPWGGEEAREFWNGVQQARSEAAAYRAAFASPEDARALKEVYPGGVAEARAAADRARVLEEIDRAYFGAAGNSPEQASAARAQLAQRMLREDPAAFREMVAAGLQALQAAGQGSGGAASATEVPRLAQVFATSSGAVGAQQAAPQPGTALANEALAASYAAFERAANEDLERSVGGAIERTLAQALPSFEQDNTPGQGAAQRAAPLRERLSSSVRADVEKALQGDRQLGEQVAQILASRRFDNEARAQVVRLITDRAQQLVPGAAKRVLNEWTQTMLAAHRGRVQPNEASVDVAPASTRSGQSLDWPSRSNRPAQSVAANRASAPRSQAINYRKLSDEQILDL